ncbi:MAG: acetoin utilization protein AcuC [Dehalococcoidia bacterium]|jgi:acetoin utilization protein AcuC|nr:acetoin utilization protein AcuC [Dehalococcoidia bacterium]MDP6511356.1 acetoin utilization protein AcuC [Dehalococcoidia bacterium]MDP6782282.1 acetoin utilization protein AcuC [Dehalococcoidia bacterium]
MKAAFVYTPRLASAGFPDHVLLPTRLQYVYELLEAYGAFSRSRLLVPRPARIRELTAFHTPEYVKAVRELSQGKGGVDPARFNLSADGDNPHYPGMYETSLLPVGGSLVAAMHMVKGTREVVFNPSGGHHHAAADCASGFCIFNDVVVAINYFLSRGMRVAYVDIDAHHGDGVQEAFYHTDQVLTISCHEWGDFLFPGTGGVEEIGLGVGRGYSANLPLYPGTDDGVYLEAFHQVVPPLVSAFAPDVLVTQLGCDTHYQDPLTHLCLTIQGYCRLVEEFKGLAPRWLALGGGGYEPGVVARAWAAAYGVMAGLDLPDQIPGSFREKYGLGHLWDTEGPDVPRDQVEEARRFARHQVEQLQALVFPYHRV